MNDVIRICSRVAADEHILVEAPLTKMARLRKMSMELRCVGRNSERDEEGSYSLTRWKSEQQVRNLNHQLSKITSLIALPIVVASNDENNNSVEDEQDEDNMSPRKSIQYLALNNWRHLSKSDSHVNETKFQEITCPPDDGLNRRNLWDVLERDLSVDKANKLKKRMYGTLMKFHTTDLATLFTFIKLNRYAHVRDELKQLLCTFVEKDLKMKVILQ